MPCNGFAPPGHRARLAARIGLHHADQQGGVLRDDRQSGEHLGGRHPDAHRRRQRFGDVHWGATAAGGADVTRAFEFTWALPSTVPNDAQGHATSATFTSFDRVTVRGGYAYYLDDIVVAGLTRVADDEQLTHDGAYVTGDRQFGQPALITGDTDTAVRFDGLNDAVAITDHVDINIAGAGYAARSVDLWFAADDVTPRQALWEEGGTVNGLVLYVEGGSLHARAWSETASWSNVLLTSTPVSASTRHHAAAILDATGGALHLYLDGDLVATATKPDAQVLAAHSDDGGIGGMFGNSEFPDGDTATGSAYFFGGVIDDVAIYNAVLSAARIEAHYRAGR